MTIIGHRGARGLAPENTIASLQKGLEHHVDMLEFDLRVTKDKVVVLHHDPYLTDPSGQKHTLADHTYGDLKNHKADLATFTEVLDQIGQQTTLMIEVKPKEPTAPIIELIAAALKQGWKPKHFLLGSFSQTTLLQLHDALPQIETVVIESWSGVRATQRARQLGTKRLNMNAWWLWRGFILSMAKRGWRIYAYNLNDPIKAKRWAVYGLAGVITDYPDLFEQ